MAARTPRKKPAPHELEAAITAKRAQYTFRADENGNGQPLSAPSDPKSRRRP